MKQKIRELRDYSKYQFEYKVFPCSFILDIYDIIWEKNFSYSYELENYYQNEITDELLKDIILNRRQISCLKTNEGLKLIKEKGFDKLSDFLIAWNEKARKIFNYRIWKNTKPLN